METYCSFLSKLNVVFISFLYLELGFAYFLFCPLGLDILTTFDALIYVLGQHFPWLEGRYIIVSRLGQCCSLRGRYKIDEIFNSDIFLFIYYNLQICQLRITQANGRKSIIGYFGFEGNDGIQYFCEYSQYFIKMFYCL